MPGKIKDIKSVTNSNLSILAKEIKSQLIGTAHDDVEIQYQTTSSGHHALIIIREKE